MVKKNVQKKFLIFKIIITLIVLAMIIYVAASPLTILFKVTMINFFAFITTQVSLKDKNQRMNIFNIGWFTITMILMAFLMFSETGKI